MNAYFHAAKLHKLRGKLETLPRAGENEVILTHSELKSILECIDNCIPKLVLESNELFGDYNCPSCHNIIE